MTKEQMISRLEELQKMLTLNPRLEEDILEEYDNLLTELNYYGYDPREDI